MEKVKLGDETLDKHTKQYERTVEVELPSTFKAKGNEIFVELLFSNEKKTGGGEIECLTFKEDQHKAIIIFQEASVAQRVLQKKEISYSDFIFKVRQTNMPKNPNQSDSVKPNGEAVFETKLFKDNQIYSKNLVDSKANNEAYADTKSEQIATRDESTMTQMYLSLHKNNRPLDEMQRYAESLTDQKAVSSEKIDANSSLINFSSKIGLFIFFFNLFISYLKFFILNFLRSK
jgi:hypothetical protein